MRRLMVALSLAVGAAVFVPLPAPRVVQAQGTICFSQNFDSGSTPFNFAFAQTPGSNWTRAFPATGGYNNTPGLEITFKAGFEQYDTGYSSGIGSCSFPTDGVIYLRFWIRYDATARWTADGSQQDKMIIFGDNDTDSRFIFMNERANSSRPCTPPDSITSEQGSFSLMKNIGSDPGPSNLDCTPYYLMTHSTEYFIQLMVNAATDTMSMWVNNPVEASPTRTYHGSGYNLGTDVNEIKWGGFNSDTPVSDFKKVWDELQISTQFDPNWPPGGGGGEPAPKRRLPRRPTMFALGWM